jgi:hypothetical protein
MNNAATPSEHEHMLPHPPHLLNLLGAAENTYIAVLGGTENAYVGVHEGRLEDMRQIPEEGIWGDRLRSSTLLSSIAPYPDSLRRCTQAHHNHPRKIEMKRGRGA